MFDDAYWTDPANDVPVDPADDVAGACITTDDADDVDVLP